MNERRHRRAPSREHDPTPRPKHVTSLCLKTPSLGRRDASADNIMSSQAANPNVRSRGLPATHGDWNGLATTLGPHTNHKPRKNPTTPWPLKPAPMSTRRQVRPQRMCERGGARLLQVELVGVDEAAEQHPQEKQSHPHEERSCIHDMSNHGQTARSNRSSPQGSRAPKVAKTQGCVVTHPNAKHLMATSAAAVARSATCCAPLMPARRNPTTLPLTLGPPSHTA